MDGINGDPWTLNQCINRRAFAGLDDDGDRPAAKALLQLFEPPVEKLGGMREGGGLGGRDATGLEGDGMGSVAPV